jgi:hypothetical protein
VNGRNRNGAEIGILLTGPGIVEDFEAKLALGRSTRITVDLALTYERAGCQTYTGPTQEILSLFSIIISMLYNWFVISPG